MKQCEILKAISQLTPYQKDKLERFVIDLMKFNEQDRN